MSQQPSGWYDDPSNPEMLRYWDGVMWTSHTAPKKSPTLPHGTGVPPRGAGSDATGAAATQGVPTPTTPMPQGSGWQGQAPQSYGQPGQPGQQVQGQQGQYGQYGQAPQYPG